MIDFIPVSEYAHYFDVTVLCMVLSLNDFMNEILHKL